MSSPPLTPRDFRALLDPLLAPLGAQGQGPIALAVSGGGDSMALLVLAYAAYPGRVTALTVDHGLRLQSAAEARQVAAWCAARGIPHRVLTWIGPKPASGIQATARIARYRLLAAACAELGADAPKSFPPPLAGEMARSDGGGECRNTPSPASPDLPRKRGRRIDRAALPAAPLLVAHTREDQAETFLLRLAHHSDLAGLGAMRAVSEIASTPPVPLLRPLLDVSGDVLRDVLRAAGQAWIEDPSNDNAAFERIRLRRLMPALAGGGLTGVALAKTSRLMARVDQMLLASAEGLCRIAPEGYATVDAARLCQLPAPIGLRALSRLLRIVGGEAYPPSRAALEALLGGLVDPAGRGATLAGCRLVRSTADWIIVRELRAARRGASTEIAGETALWDNRFWVRLPASNQSFVISPLGPGRQRPAGRGQAVDRGARLARETLPGLWQGGHLVEVPEVAPNIETFARHPNRPAALYVGVQRVDGELCRIWRQVQKNTASKECVMPTVS